MPTTITITASENYNPRFAPSGAQTVESAIEGCWALIDVLPEKMQKKVLAALKARVSPPKPKTSVEEGAAEVQPAPASEVEIVHRCSDGTGTFPCCGKTPFEVPRNHRMTSYPELVTCNAEKAKSSSPSPGRGH